MQPFQPMFGGKITIIRPLALVEENEIRKFVNHLGLREIPNQCPTAQTSRRREIKQLLARLYTTNRKIKGNIFRSMGNVKTDYLLNGGRVRDPR